VGVIEVPRVKLDNGLVRTKNSPTSAPTASLLYITGHNADSFIQGGSAAGRWQTRINMSVT